MDQLTTITDSRPSSVVIVGGSLTGLMYGIMMKRLGCSVTILEQDPKPEDRPHSAGIGFGVNLDKFLFNYDLTQSRVSIPMDCAHISWRQYVGIWQASVKRQLTSWGLLYNILRANFDGMASEACPLPPKSQKNEGKVEYLVGSRVFKLEPCDYDEPVTVHYRDTLANEYRRIQTDLVIAADGVHSTIRRLLQPSIIPTYAGYVVWRAMVPESQLPKEVAGFFSNGASTNLLKKSYIISYLIPTDDGCFEKGKRLINWLWYYNVQDGSAEMTDIFTDKHGIHHRNTVPAGMIRSDVWERHRDSMISHMAAPFAALIMATKSPFVIKVNDVLSTDSSFYGGKVILAGDAHTTVRPHLAGATDQAAWQCICLNKVWAGDLTQKACNHEIQVQSKKLWLTSRLVGLFGQGSWLLLLKTVLLYIVFCLQSICF